MANQVEPEVGSGTAPPSGQLAGAQPDSPHGEEVVPGSESDPGHGHASHHGRPLSWVAVALIMAGFVCGGLALIFGPSWIAFWVGAGIVVVGGALALGTNIMGEWY